MPTLEFMDIRMENIKKILDALRFGGGLTKKELAQRTELSFSTVSNLCNDLEERGVLAGKKLETAGLGRNPSKLCFQHDHFCCLCLNLQMKNVLGLSVLDFQNNFLYRTSYSIPFCKTPEDILAYAKQAYDGLKEELGLDKRVLAGIGIAVSSVHDTKTSTLVNCAIPMYEDVPLKGMAEELFGVEAYVDNESNLAALGVQNRHLEWRRQVYLHISQGVGVGILSNGELLRGKNGYAAEISHIPLGPADRLCHICGGKGCVEAELCLKSLVEPYESLLEENLTLLEKWEVISHGINSGDPIYADFAGKRGVLIGQIASLLANLFDPDVLYIGGTISKVYDKLQPYIRQELVQRSHYPYSRGMETVCDTESDTTIFLGINQIVYNKWNPLHMRLG